MFSNTLDHYCTSLFYRTCKFFVTRKTCRLLATGRIIYGAWGHKLSRKHNSGTSTRCLRMHWTVYLEESSTVQIQITFLSNSRATHSNTSNLHLYKDVEGNHLFGASKIEKR